MIVPGEGPIGAKVMIIGEAPGQQEEATGRPFIGGSGQLLDECLAHAKINRRDCYVTNVVKIRPPNNDFDTFYTDSKRQSPGDFLVKSIAELQEEISRVNPAVLVPVGDEALRAVTGRRAITKWRGSILSTSLGRKCIPTIHPAAALREYTFKWIIQFDLRRVREEMDDSRVVLPRPSFYLRPSFDFCMDFLRSIVAGCQLSYDIETIGDLIRCLGVSTSATDALCIPFMAMSAPRFGVDHGNIDFESQTHDPLALNSYWSEEEELAIHRELYRIFFDPTILKIAQNMPFDTTRLQKQFGYRFRGMYCDTMLAWHNLYSELPKGLDFLVSVLTRFPYYSDYNVAVDEEVWRYNCFDVVGTWECCQKIVPMLKSQGIDEFFFRHQMPAMLHLSRISNRGIAVDTTKREEFKTIFRSKMEQQIKSIEGYLNQKAIARGTTPFINFNPNSTPQMRRAFYDVLGFPIQKNRKTGAVTCDKDARDRLRKRVPEHAAWLDSMDEWSHLDTLISGFLEKPTRSDGRIYTHFNLAGTVTGRIASAEPLDGDGTNLTNQPKGNEKTGPHAASYGFRRCYIAPPGYLLIKADLSAAEWFCVCWLGGFTRFIQRYKENPEWVVHKYAASLVFNIPESSVEKGSEQYNLAKNGVYGGSYGMQAPRAAAVWKIAENMARFVLDRWHQAAPEVRGQYWKRVQSLINTCRTLTNPVGRKRIFLDRIPFPAHELDQIYRDAYSHWAQSTVADVINRALALCDFYFPPTECRLLLQVHDELVFEVREDLAEAYARRVKRFMEYPLDVPGVDVPLLIKAEVTIGPNWHDGRKVNL